MATTGTSLFLTMAAVPNGIPGQYRLQTVPDIAFAELPSPEPALNILEERRADATYAGSEFVFPGTGKCGHLTEPKRAWTTVLEKAGLTDLRLHDLRRTFGSWQAGTGANLSVIGRSLNHKSLAITKVYDRLWLDPVRDSMKNAVTAMFKAGGLPPTESPVGSVKDIAENGSCETEQIQASNADGLSVA